MKIKVHTLNSFAKTKIGGNPAGVVLEADNLTEDHMNKVANKVASLKQSLCKNPIRPILR